MRVYITDTYKRTAPIKLYQEYGSYVTHDGMQYDLNAMFRYISGGNAILKIMKISDLDWILSYSKPDKAREKKANPKYPIIVTKDTNEGKLVVLDGLHRLSKSKKLGGKYMLGLVYS